MEKQNPIMKIHLALMILMMCGTVGGAVNFIVSAVNSKNTHDTFSNLTNVILMVFILLMLIMGAVYLIKGYSKQAAVYYKAFMLFHVGVCVISDIVNLAFYKTTALMTVISVLYVFKALDLLIMVFGKDLFC